jgi:3-oxoacyl-[acyl-carrier protein] reductase
MDLGIKGKNALVTGASRGIGRGISLALAAEGVNIVAVATKAAAAEETAAACRAQGVKALGRGVDVKSFQAVEDLAAEVQKELGPVQILVNNAGITRDGLLLRMSEEDFDAVVGVNLKGVFNLCRAFARPMLREKGTRIINISSVVGLTGNAGQANYAASKGGVIALTKSLAKEFAGRGMTVNAVAPGFIRTDMTSDVEAAKGAEIVKSIPLSRFGEVADVAAAVLYLASEAAAYVTGTVLVVDGGISL